MVFTHPNREENQTAPATSSRRHFHYSFALALTGGGRQAPEWLKTMKQNKKDGPVCEYVGV
jgi:hypothetical protein